MKNIKRKIAAFLAGLCLMTVSMPVFAAEETSASTGDLVVSGYTATYKGRPAGKIEKGKRVSITVDARKPGLTTATAGKISVSASSSSFRIPKEALSVEVISGESDPLSLRIRFTDIVYNGKDDVIHFKVSYGSGGNDSGEVHIYECVISEKKSDFFSNSGSEEKKDPAKTTHYGAPVILISRNDIKDPIMPGDVFQVKINLQNMSAKITAADVVASFEPSDGVSLLEESTSRYLRTLRPKENQSITLRMRANKEIASPSQSVAVSLKYDYVENDQRNSSTVSEKILLPFDPSSISKTSDIATPNIIISKYNYGERVAVGQTFDLSLTVQNTNPEVPVENLVMSLETGEGLSMANSSNTFFFPQISAGGVLSQTVEMQALPNAKMESPKIDVSFKYEYLNGEKRTQVSSGEKIAIPVYQPDRFQVSPPSQIEGIVQFQETTISLPYVNKGKSEVSNVEAKLIGENFQALETHQNLGNFEAGKSGSIDFILTPEESGKLPVKVQITYEDSNMKVKTLDFPITLNIEEPPVEEFDYSEVLDDGAETNNAWIYWCIGGILTIALALFIRARKRHKKQPVLSGDTALLWDDEEETPLLDGEAVKSHEA